MKRSTFTLQKTAAAVCLLSVLTLSVHQAYAAKATGKPVRYNVVELNPLPGAREGTAYSINNEGVVAGRSGKDDGSYVAVLWRNGQIQTLGGLGGAYSEAHSINDSGEIVGAAQAKSGLYHAFFWVHGHMQDLGVLPNGLYSYAEAVNGGGTVTGFADNGSGIPHAFLWTGSGLKDIGPAPGVGGSSALGINRKGAVVGGSSLDSDDGGIAFIYTGQFRALVGFPPKFGSIARAVNDSGTVVGSYGQTVRRAYPFAWQSGHLIVLPTGRSTPYAVATSINSSGVIAGYYLGTAESRAAIWVNHKMIDLNQVIPGGTDWTLLQATGINDHGQIIGRARYHGRDVGFLLTPQ